VSIQVFRSDQSGAPSLTGQVGSLITLFDACLVNGYATISVSSITRASATATVTTATAHGLATGDWALMSGAAQAAYNIKAKVTVLTATTFTYTVAGSPATPATGTLLTRRAGGGFSKPFSGTNIGVYRADDVAGQRRYFQVTDDGTATNSDAKEAILRGYETMTAVNTGTGLFPTSAQRPQGYYIQKSSTADATARAWVLITDGNLVYFFVNANSANSTSPNGSSNTSACFGDFISYKAGDIYNSITAANNDSNFQSNGSYGLAFGTQNPSGATTTIMVAARDFTALGGAAGLRLYLNQPFSNCVGGSSAFAFPNPVDNGYYICPLVLAGANHVRGRLPGAFEPAQGRQLGNWDLVTNVQGYSGRTFMHMWVMNGGSQGAILIDITGTADAWD
jgi:hypothetical protein